MFAHFYCSLLYNESFLLLLFSHSVVSNSLWPHGLQHARLSCPSLSPRGCSSSCPLCQWCHPTISSPVTPFSSCPLSFPASGSFPMSQFFASGDQSIGASISASVLPINIQSWFPLGLTGLISLLSKGLSKALLGHMVFCLFFFPPQDFSLVPFMQNEWTDRWISFSTSLCYVRAETTHPPPIFEVPKLFLGFPGDTWCMTCPKPTKWHIPLTPHPALTSCGTCHCSYTQKVPGARQSPHELLLLMPPRA